MASAERGVRADSSPRPASRIWRAGLTLALALAFVFAVAAQFLYVAAQIGIFVVVGTLKAQEVGLEALPAIIVAGMLVGASGTILTDQMAKAMNRSIASVSCAYAAASTFTATVTGAAGQDRLTIAASTSLSARIGLSALVDYRQGDATSLPFQDGSFDIVWTEHVAMPGRPAADPAGRAARRDA